MSSRMAAISTIALAAALVACSPEDARVSTSPPPASASQDAPLWSCGADVPEGPLHDAFCSRLARYATDGRAYGLVDAEVVERPMGVPRDSRVLWTISEHSSEQIQLRVGVTWPDHFSLANSFRDWQLVDGDIFSPGLCRLAREQDPYPPEHLVVSVISARRSKPLLASAWRLWVYAATWFLSDGPAYSEDQYRTDVAELRRELSAALRAGDTTRALSILRDLPKPHGDFTESDLYGKLSLQAGHVGHYLQIRAITLDRFPEARFHGFLGSLESRTDIAALEALGVDIDRLLLGLVLDPDVPEEERGALPIDTWRLSQWIREAGRSAALVPALAKMARDEELDEWNRLRATAVLEIVAAERYSSETAIFDFADENDYSACAIELRGPRPILGWSICNQE